MIPAPGEAPKDYWKNTRHKQAVRTQAARDGGLTGHSDPFVQFYHDVPRKLAERAMRFERSESAAAFEAPWPLTRWPNVPTKVVVCTEDRFFPPPGSNASPPTAWGSSRTRSRPAIASR